MRRAPKRQSKIGLLLIVIAMLVTVIANGIRVANLKAKSERLAVTERPCGEGKVYADQEIYRGRSQR